MAQIGMFQKIADDELGVIRGARELLHGFLNDQDEGIGDEEPECSRKCRLRKA